MNKVFEIIKQAHEFRSILKKCKKASPEGEAYTLGKFYKDEIEKLEGSHVNETKINQIIEKVNEDINRHQDSNQVKEVLESVVSFLTTLKRFS